MSQLRKRYRVAWDAGEPVEVVTNAWDMSAAQDHQGNMTLQTFAVIHHALERDGLMPPPLEKWIETLDDMAIIGDDDVPPAHPAAMETAATVEANEMGPTKPGRSRGGRAR